MADTLGEAYLQIVVQGIDQAISEMKRLEETTESSVKKSESTINNLSNLKRQILNQDIKAAQDATEKLDSLENIASSRKQQRINDLNTAHQKNVESYKNLAANAGRSSQEIQNHISTMAQRLTNDLKDIEAGIGRGGVGFATASMNILKAAPAFAVATAAIGVVYGALRGLRDEFVAGLSAVEDYQLKVASMGAFLTTFNKNLTQTNAAEIYRSSNVEAQKLVDTMQILDARTIASGKDLTTMAEQFIKGGVKIDTSNKGTLDGFVNIANALKLLTQGQNQEIQMRQEIRALTQGQVRDQNIVVQTLKGIDPQIKEHIKLWKQQGTLIENVGNLLAGFGPAAKDLEQTWAVVGSTMSTIHDRILRGAFKPTYDSLVQTAKEWNRTLMNTDGTLTKFSENIIGTLKFMAKFVENFVTLLAVVTPIAIGVGLISAAFGALNFAISSLTITMLQNPLTAGLVAVTIGLTAKTIYDLTKSQQQLNSETQSLTSGTAGLNAEMDKMSPSSKQPVLNFLDQLKTKASSAFNELNKLKGVDVRAIGNIFARGPMMLAGGDAELTSSIQNVALGRARKEIDKEELDKGIDALKKHNEELGRQNDLYKKSNVETEKYELTLGKYAETLNGLRATGKASAAQAFEDSILKKAAAKDANVANEKALSDAKALQSHQESSRNSLNNTIKSLQAMNLTQENSQLAIWKSHFANKEWIAGLKLSIPEIEKFKAAIYSEAQMADERKASEERLANLEKLQNKMLQLSEKYSTDEEKIVAQNKRAIDQINDLIDLYEKQGLAAVDTNGKILNSIIDLYDKEDRLQKKSQGDWELANTAKGKSFKELSNGIYSSMTDAFSKIFDKGESFFKNLTNSLLSLFKKMLAQMAVLALAQPIIVPIVQVLGGIMGMSSEAQASQLKSMGIESNAATTGSVASGLAALGGAAAIGSMVSGPSTGREAATSAGVGIAGLALESYSSTGGQLSSTLMGSAQDKIAEYVSTNLSAELGTSITDMSSAAFSGWAAGIGTFVIGLLRGEGFKTAALKGVGAGLGAWGGYAAGTAVAEAAAGWAAGATAGAESGSWAGPVGAVIGAALGALLGGLLGGGKKEHSFTLSEQAQNVSTSFDKLSGFTPHAINAPTTGDTSSWYGPIANAYSDVISTIQEDFNSNLFAFADKLPKEMQTLLLDNLEKTDFYSITQQASGGRWGVSGAQGALEGIAQRYADGLAKAVNDAYKNALTTFIQTADPSQLLGPDLQTTYAVLTAAAQAQVKAMFEAAGKAMSTGGLQAGVTEINKITDELNKIRAATAPIQEIIDTNGLTEYELAIRNINKQFDGYAESLKNAGVDLTKYTQLEEAREIVLSRAAATTSRLTEEEKKLTDARSAVLSASDKVTSITENINSQLQGFASAADSSAAAVVAAQDNISNALWAAQDEEAAAQQRVNDLIKESADNLHRFAATIDDFLTTINPATSSMASLDSLKAQFQLTASLASGGDSTAQGRLIDQASAVLMAAEASSTSAVEYARSQAFVRSQLLAVKEAIDPTPVVDAVAEAVISPLEIAQTELKAAQDRVAAYAVLAQETGARTDRTTRSAADSIASLSLTYNSAMAANTIAQEEYQTALLLTTGLTFSSSSAIEVLQSSLDDLAIANAEFLLTITENMAQLDGSWLAFAMSLGLSGTQALTFAEQLSTSGLSVADLSTAFGLTGSAANSLGGILGLAGEALTNFITAINNSNIARATPAQADYTSLIRGMYADNALATAFNPNGPDMQAIAYWNDQINALGLSAVVNGGFAAQVTATATELIRAMYSSNAMATAYNPTGPSTEAIDFWLQNTMQSGWAATQESFPGAVSAYAVANPLPQFADGSNYIPHDMTARIHAGEEITPRPYVDLQRAERSESNILLRELVRSNSELRIEVAALRKSNEDTAKNTKRTSDTLVRVSRDGESLVTVAA